MVLLLITNCNVLNNLFTTFLVLKITFKSLISINYPL